MNFPLFQYFLYAAALLSLYRVTFLYTNGLILIVYFLLLNTVVETIGFYTFNNTWLYNISNIIEIVILNFLFYNKFKSPAYKTYSLVTSIVYLVFSFWNITYGQGMSDFNSYSFLLGCLALVISACLFLYEFLLTERYNSFYREGAIWITAGIIIFYSCCFLILGSYNFLVKSDMNLLAQLFSIIRLINLLMYCLIIFGILCLKKVTN